MGKTAMASAALGIRVRGVAPFVRAGLSPLDEKRPVSQYARLHKMGVVLDAIFEPG
ncbi:MAG: hypothetical protein AAGC72_17455 [Planctomycetota bacterium]